ncbi:enoyl-CoA hydratase/isomerase family protein [Micrococcaceae bacterium Sec5.1]
MTSQHLQVEQRGAVRWLFLNRPAQRNALNGALANALAAQVDDIAHDPGTAVVVLAGKGKSFSAGGDFRHFLALEDESEAGVVEFLERLSNVVTTIERSSKPWVAALHGHAIAGGLELALACDVVIAAEGTLVGDGHLNNKLTPGAGSSVRLERAVGKSPARWMHLSGQPMTAEALRPTGWLHDVVPYQQLHLRAAEVAAQLAARDSPAQQNLKNLLSSIVELDDSDALDLELAAFQANWRDNNVPDALRQFLAARRLNQK